MKTTAANTAIRLLSYGIIFSLFFVLIISSHPQKAAAAEISVAVNTQQVLPPGANTCAPIAVTNFTPYIYDGALNAFDFTVNDPAYVALVASIGDTSIPFYHMRRDIDASGALRMHIDTASIPVRGNLQITITMLASHGAGSPVCASSISLGITDPSYAPIIPVPTPKPVPSAPPVVTPAPETPTSATSTEGSATTTPAATSTEAGITKNPLAGVCYSMANTHTLWLILLAAYIIFIAALLWPEKIAQDGDRTLEWRIVGVLAPLIILLAFWYFSASCRSDGWVVLAMLAVAVAGVIAAAYTHPRAAKQLLLLDLPKKDEPKKELMKREEKKEEPKKK